MSRQVRLEPSGHSFVCEQHETLLEAALRQGINADHHCASGTCGSCQARLISGEVERQPHDFTFTEAQKLQKLFLMCSSTPLTDLVIEAQIANSPDDIPLQSIPAQVKRMEPLSDEYLALTLRTPRTRTLRFLAGQSARLTFPGWPALTLPIASCPCNGLMLQFHVRRVKGSALNDYLFNDLRPGTQVELEGPCGRFTLDEASRRPIVMVAQETGFAPIRSLIEHAIALEKSQPIRLYWYSHAPEGHYQANYCRSWGDVLDDFRFHPRVINADTLAQADYSAVSDEINTALQELGEADIYLATEAELERQLKQTLAQGDHPRHLFSQFGCER